MLSNRHHKVSHIEHSHVRQVRKMTIQNFHIQLLAMMFSLTLSGYVIAENTAQNENKYTRASNTFSDVDDTHNVGSNAHPALDSTQNTEFFSEPYSIEKGSSAEETYQKQREALWQYLQDRHRRTYANPDEPLDAESRREKFIKDIEQRRQMIDKMYQHRRKSIEEDRRERLFEMHKTSVDSPLDIHTS